MSDAKIVEIVEVRKRTADREKTGKKKKRNSVKTGLSLWGLLGAAVFWFFAFFVALVPINIHAPSFFIALMGSLGVYGFVKVLSRIPDLKVPEGDEKAYRPFERPFYILLALFLVFVVAALSGAPIFHAGGYASILPVRDAEFSEDLPESFGTDSIALMDTASARMLGDREIGALASVVSQYNVSDEYSQIDYQGTPKKVAALDYAGFFKWIGNHKTGVPGYVTVDPVSMSASYQEAASPMIYVPSAYFLEDAARRIRMAYPTAMFGNLHFEIDEEGHPFYIASVYKKTISLFGGKTVSGCIILDPVTGHMDAYSLEDVPVWADIVYDGDTICRQYNWFGTYQNGFWNSIFGKRGCRQVTRYASSDDDKEDQKPAADYGYVAKDGDIWIYTGITSVNNDSSNIGFLLANERTGESHYFAIAGADEKSAMAAAEGEVQEKRYQASFPSLINVDDNPTYIMVMKDSSGLVKLYAAVNVEQYNLVTTAATQAECLKKYRALLGLSSDEEVLPSPGRLDMTDARETEVTIRDIRDIVIDGNTYIYLIGSDEQILRARASEHEEMLLLLPGQKVKVLHVGQDIIRLSRLDEE